MWLWLSHDQLILGTSPQFLFNQFYKSICTYSPFTFTRINFPQQFKNLSVFTVLSRKKFKSSQKAIISQPEKVSINLQSLLFIYFLLTSPLRFIRVWSIRV